MPGTEIRLNGVEGHLFEVGRYCSTSGELLETKFYPKRLIQDVTMKMHSVKALGGLRIPVVSISLQNVNVPLTFDAVINDVAIETYSQVDPNDREDFVETITEGTKRILTMLGK